MISKYIDLFYAYILSCGYTLYMTFISGICNVWRCSLRVCCSLCTLVMYVSLIMDDSIYSKITAIKIKLRDSIQQYALDFYQSDHIVQICCIRITENLEDM